MMPQMQALLLITLGLPLASTLAKDFLKQPFHLRSLVWGNCEEGKDPVVIKSLIVQPNLIVHTGSVTVSAQTQTSVTLDAPQKVQLTVQKEMASFWVKVLRVKQIGICYDSLCDIFDICIPPGGFSPESLRSYALPCQCPFKEGIYSLPKRETTLPHLELPGWSYHS
ncbi:ganglioside GM2 activator-like [Myotis daubentonii]|uniref:ganglioside GM2 activator-like n=1 Tax=Myotis daubentonii TaxID=98922 RepID=UPI002872C064|nr:ganglioside GM2 activator-like [Myotis daubentonii]